MNPSKALGRIYGGLELFTSLYLIVIAFEFFSNFHVEHPTLEKVLDGFSEPYLAALGVYVILKEIYKRRTAQAISLHRGEVFVLLWAILLFLTTVAVVSTEHYRFDAVYGLIISNSLASLMIYIGSRIHKP